MKTDPISAAAAYRMYLRHILDARVLHEAKAHASKALDITFEKPEQNTIAIASGFGMNSKQAFVTIALSSPVETANPAVQLATHQARQIAMQILEAADAAESDGFVLEWLMTGTSGLSEGQAAALLNDFRAWRDRQRKRQEG
jgi:hypothetical protein